MSRIVTERDLRKPEFADAKVEDLEFRDDGELVRKDRWETGLRSIAYALGFNGRGGFEIHEVVYRVDQLVEMDEGIKAAAAQDIWETLSCELDVWP